MNALILLFALAVPTYIWENPYPNTFRTRVGEWTCTIEIWGSASSARKLTLTALSPSAQPENVNELLVWSTELVNGEVQGEDNRLFKKHCAPAFRDLPEEVRKLAPKYFRTR